MDKASWEHPGTILGQALGPWAPGSQARDESGHQEQLSPTLECYLCTILILWIQAGFEVSRKIYKLCLLHVATCCLYLSLQMHVDVCIRTLP